jgi:hypothetical protein
MDSRKKPWRSGSRMFVKIAIILLKKASIIVGGATQRVVGIDTHFNISRE